VFATRERPVEGTRGVYRAALRLDVSQLRAGSRTTLGIIFTMRNERGARRPPRTAAPLGPGRCGSSPGCAASAAGAERVIVRMPLR
jgi:hypothetical protein